jgi:predicted dehydrogenase
MRFALLGVHPDGVQLVRALVESGRHQLLVYTNAIPGSIPERWGQDARRVSDLEEILADPAIDAVIVASQADGRPVHLRRALQSERHVLCVYPPDQTPETAYEAAMIRKDVGFLLFPLLPDRLHPALECLTAVGPAPDQGDFRLLEIEWSETGPALLNTETAGHKPSFPAWDLLRQLGGEIAEVMGFAAGEVAPADEPVLLAGRFERGGLFRVTFLPRQSTRSCRLTLVGPGRRAELSCPEGWRGPAQLTWFADEQKLTEMSLPSSGKESWPTWDPWPTVVEDFEADLERASPPNKGERAWQDAVRMLELDDAARRSIEKRRGSLLEYPDATEEVGFKGIMTLAGCGVLWLVIFLLILSRWVPFIGLLTIPILAIFLILQLLRFAIPRKPEKPPP